MEKKFKYIVIEGPIGSGKTSLVHLLKKRLNSQIILEKFEENPLLEKFYNNTTEYAFHTQIYFLINRYQQQIKEVQEFSLFHKHLISDYFFNKDKIFAYLNLTDQELYVYEKMYRAFEPDIMKPDVILYLKAPTDVLMSRIKKRGRDFERGMDWEYLENLNAAYSHYFKYYGDCPVFSIDAGKHDWVGKEKDQETILDKIEDLLDNKKQITELILENSNTLERND